MWDIRFDTHNLLKNLKTKIITINKETICTKDQVNKKIKVAREFDGPLEKAG
jgi:hypothetical protein